MSVAAAFALLWASARAASALLWASAMAASSPLWESVDVTSASVLLRASVGAALTCVSVKFATIKRVKEAKKEEFKMNFCAIFFSVSLLT